MKRQPKTIDHKITAKLMEALCLLSPWLSNVENQLDGLTTEIGQMVVIDSPELFSPLTPEAVARAQGRDPLSTRGPIPSARLLTDSDRLGAIRRISALILAARALGDLVVSVEYKQCAGYVCNAYKYRAEATKIGFDGGRIWVWRCGNISRSYGKGPAWSFKITLGEEAARILGRKTISA